MAENSEDMESAMMADAINSIQTEGYMQTTFKEWCLENPELVLSHKDGHLQRHEIFSRVHSTTVKTFEDFFKSSFISSSTLGNGKDDQKSEDFRNQGNELFKKKNVKESLKMYSKSLRYATEDSKNLPLAFANRSAAYFQLGNYNDCLLDVDRAIKQGYPRENRYKLLDRRLRCLAKIGASKDELNNAKIEIINDVNDLKDSLPEAKRKQILEDIKKVQVKTSAKEQQNSEPAEGLSLGKRNSKFPCFSTCVNVEYSKTKGRHTIAGRNIGAGELILLEEPTLCSLNFDRRDQFCSYSFKKVESFVPSKINTLDVFYDEGCIEKAATLESHDSEAKISKCLENSGIKRQEWFLAMAALTKLKEENEIRRWLDFDNHKFGVEDGTAFGETENFEGMFSLMTHSEAKEEDIFQTFVASFFVRLINLVNDFGEELQILQGHLAIKVMHLASVNCHEIGHFQKAEGAKTWHENTPMTLGSAMYPHLAMLNHNCYSNTLRVNVGNKVALFASRDIKEGDEITDSYLSNPLSLSKDFRRSELRRKYFFTCECLACGEGWPESFSFPKSLGDIPESQLNFSDGNFGRIQGAFSGIAKMGGRINVAQSEGKYKEAFALCIEFLRTLNSVIKPPHLFYEMTQKSISILLWILNGSKSVQNS